MFYVQENTPVKYYTDYLLGEYQYIESEWKKQILCQI